MGHLSHLNAVMNNAETREVYQALLPSLSEYYTQLGQHTALYQTYQQIHDSNVFQTLSEAQQSAIKLALRDFKLSGVALQGEAKNVMQKSRHVYHNCLQTSRTMYSMLPKPTLNR